MTVSSDVELPLRIQINFETKEPDEGEPEQTVGAGSRNAEKCTDPQDYKALTLLVPANTVALTVAERPMFFVYFPKTVATQAELSLRDEQGNGIYQTIFDLGETPGIQGIQLPITAPALEVGRRYQWSIAMICNADDRLRDQVADAWIQRIDLPASLSQQLQNAAIAEQASLYAQNGIWYDTISTLAEFISQSENSTVATNAWQQLLSSETVQLDQFLEIRWRIQEQHGEN
ncbi:hypothetical protein AM228_11825 [Planktothricoides sp. SR001]|nr:hypothetical protein AM228_11825 [Planktothricoides sp. SR001]